MTRRAHPASVLVPCTCGELVQGVVGGRLFLVSCPIDRFSRVEVTLGGELPASSRQPVARPRAGTLGPRTVTLSAAKSLAGHGDGHSPYAEVPSAELRAGPSTELRAGPSTSLRAGLRLAQHDSGGALRTAGGDPHPPPECEGTMWGPRAPSTLVPSCTPGPGHRTGPREKAEEAVRVTLRHLGMPETPFELRVACPLSPSRGFGTSTADVVGAIVATSTAAGVALGPEEVARLAVSIEPSDGTMFPGLVAFAHRDASWYEALAPAPPLLVAVLEMEGTVDTLEFNARLDLSSAAGANELEHSRALELLRRGLRDGDLELVGEAATLSARANQRVLPKPQLEETIDTAGEAGALGVCAAHSGTALGALFRPGEDARAERFLALARERIGGLVGCWVSRMVDGGPRAG